MDIESLFVEIDPEGFVRLEMNGLTMDGVIAFPDVSVKPYPFGDVELIPGLWYYDEDYSNFHHPKYKKKIDAMIRKGKLGSRE